MNRFFVILKRPLLAVFLLLLLQMAVGMVILIDKTINGSGGMADGVNNHMPDAALISIAMVVTNVLMAILSLFIFRRKQYTRSQYVASTSTWRQNIVGMTGCFLGIVALDMLIELFDIPNLMELQLAAICNTTWGMAAVVLAAPLGEEMLFRWGIMGHLLHHNRSVVGAIFVSALLFGIIHMNPAQVFFATIMGILLGVLYWKTGNVFLPMLLHMLNNATACLQVRLLGDDIKDFSLVQAMGGPGIAWGVVAVCSVLCLGLMGWYSISRPSEQEIDIDEELNTDETKDTKEIEP